MRHGHCSRIRLGCRGLLRHRACRFRRTFRVLRQASIIGHLYHQGCCCTRAAWKANATLRRWQIPVATTTGATFKRHAPSGARPSRSPFSLTGAQGVSAILSHPHPGCACCHGAGKQSLRSCAQSCSMDALPGIRQAAVRPRTGAFVVHTNHGEVGGVLRFWVYCSPRTLVLVLACPRSMTRKKINDTKWGIGDGQIQGKWLLLLLSTLLRGYQPRLTLQQRSVGQW